MVTRPIRLIHDRLQALEGLALARFNHWFTSQGGVYQTFLMTLVIVTAEAVFPSLDNHGFWLLYWLTVYSAITQPALAYSTAMDADRLQAILADLHAEIAAISARLATLDERTGA